MTCPFCRKSFCATSEAQLAARRANMRAHPDVDINPCPVCGGTDWATSHEMVAAELPRPPSMWRRAMDYFSGTGQ